MHGDVSQFKTAPSIFAFHLGYNCQGEGVGLAGRKLEVCVCESGLEIINRVAEQEIGGGEPKKDNRKKKKKKSEKTKQNKSVA